jgi:C1A family cysteine protease
MMIIGYDNTKRAVLIENSFGTAWGGDGFHFQQIRNSHDGWKD